MEKRTFIFLGAILIIVSGTFYTAERVAAILAGGLADGGSAIHGGGTFGTVDYPGFFDNLFVYMFFVLGLLLIGVGFVQKKS
nr:hypothetical protein [Paenibacillus bovis]